MSHQKLPVLDMSHQKLLVVETGGSASEILRIKQDAAWNDAGARQKPRLQTAPTGR
jgi:hypothetical protein